MEVPCSVCCSGGSGFAYGRWGARRCDSQGAGVRVAGHLRLCCAGGPPQRLPAGALSWVVIWLATIIRGFESALRPGCERHEVRWKLRHEIRVPCPVGSTSGMDVAVKVAWRVFEVQSMIDEFNRHEFGSGVFGQHWCTVTGSSMSLRMQSMRLCQK